MTIVPIFKINQCHIQILLIIIVHHILHKGIYLHIHKYVQVHKLTKARPFKIQEL